MQQDENSCENSTECPSTRYRCFQQLAGQGLCKCAHHLAFEGDDCQQNNFAVVVLECSKFAIALWAVERALTALLSLRCCSGPLHQQSQKRKIHWLILLATLGTFGVTLIDVLIFPDVLKSMQAYLAAFSFFETIAYVCLYASIFQLCLYWVGVAETRKQVPIFLKVFKACIASLQMLYFCVLALIILVLQEPGIVVIFSQMFGLLLSIFLLTGTWRLASAFVPHLGHPAHISSTSTSTCDNSPGACTSESRIQVHIAATRTQKRLQQEVGKVKSISCTICRDFVMTFFFSVLFVKSAQGTIADVDLAILSRMAAFLSMMDMHFAIIGYLTGLPFSWLACLRHICFNVSAWLKPVSISPFYMMSSMEQSSVFSSLESRKAKMYAAAKPSCCCPVHEKLQASDQNHPMELGVLENTTVKRQHYRHKHIQNKVLGVEGANISSGCASSQCRGHKIYPIV